MSLSNAAEASGTAQQPSRDPPGLFGAVAGQPAFDQPTTPEGSDDQVEFGTVPRFDRAVEQLNVDEVSYRPLSGLSTAENAPAASAPGQHAPPQVTEPSRVVVNLTMDIEGEEGTNTPNEETPGNARGVSEAPSASSQRSVADSSRPETPQAEPTRSERRNRRRIRRLNQLEALLEGLAESTRRVATEVERMLVELRDTRSMLSTHGAVAQNTLAAEVDGNALRALAEFRGTMEGPHVYLPPMTLPPVNPSAQTPTGRAAPRESTPPSPMSQRIQQIRQAHEGETPRQRPRRPQRRSATDSPSDGATTTTGSGASASGSSRRQRRRTHVPAPPGQGTPPGLGAPPRLSTANAVASGTATPGTAFRWNVTSPALTETATVVGPNGTPVTYEVLRPWFMRYYAPPLLDMDSPNTTRLTSTMREQVLQQRARLSAGLLQAPFAGVAPSTGSGDDASAGGSNVSADIEREAVVDGECAGSADGINAKGHCHATFVGRDWLCQYCRRGL